MAPYNIDCVAVEGKSGPVSSSIHVLLFSRRISVLIGDGRGCSSVFSIRWIHSE
jgi:hypothetical protein